mgnify:CR=1 FL=1
MINFLIDNNVNFCVVTNTCKQTIDIFKKDYIEYTWKWGDFFNETITEDDKVYYEPNTHWGQDQAILSFSKRKEAFLFSLYIK